MSATKNINAEKIQGNLNITSISATTISGTTFYGDGSNLTGISSEDNFVTGGTYNDTTNNINFSGNSVETTFDVDLTSLVSSVSGDTYVVGGTYVDSTNTISLLRNDGNFVNVTGITNTYVTGGTVSVPATNSSNDGTIGLFYKDSDGTPRTLPFEDTYTTGSTYDNGNALATFDRNDGTSYTLDLSTIDVNDTFVTGFTYNDANTFTISNNDGTSFNSSINIMTGLTTNTINATTVDATTISGDTFYGDGSGLVNVPSDTLYTVDGTVGSSRTVTITDTLTTTGGQEIRVVNGRTYREITQASDLPTTLVANTTYLFKGEISISNNITCSVDGVEFIGSNREVDGVIWTGTGAFLTLTDCNFDFSNMKFSSTTSGNSILDATNVAASGYNNNRLKVLAFVNCQFRGTYDVMDIKGYDLVDINNTLFFYIKATNFGLRFQDTSKLEISSCELIRWFDESTIPTPSGWATCSMIELQSNNLASFGAVNINGCIIHPQQTQNGIDISTSSTTGFATIAANAFINAGLTTGEVFLPVISAALPNYSDTSTTTYDIYSNQGLLDSKAGSIHTLVGNTTDTALSLNTPVIVNSGGGTVQQAGVRFDVTSAGRATYIGTKQLYLSIHITLTFLKQGKGTDDYVFYIALNGSVIPASETPLRDLDDVEGGLGLVYGTLMNTNDYIELWVENTSSNDDMLVTGYKILIRE